MNAPFDTPEQIALTLDGEWARIEAMIALSEAQRTGRALTDGFADHFASLSDLVETARKNGVWAGLGDLLPTNMLEEITTVDLDLLALALAPVAMPTLAPRLQSLQPHLATAWPSLALVQELLMLETGTPLARMIAQLSSGAPLIAGGLIKLDGKTPNQILRPAPQTIRQLLGRDAELAPPDGATLSQQTGEWDQLVLPRQTLTHLGDFAAWIAHSTKISRDWGGRKTYGPLALFTGPSGTGKSFAANVIATDLSKRTGQTWSLFTLDLGRIMSKYVGETEANLNALLDSLEGRHAILQIDEADGLLGKRGEVSDARDRYANLEVSHMLARFERHAGPVILTTNLRGNVDAAFLRRFQLIVDFPTPDAASRARLWRVLLPPKAPLCPDLDLDATGSAVRLSGGAIANAATYAAILAAQDQLPIGLPHIARAVWAELGKDARQVRDTELGFLKDHLPAEATS